MKRRVFKLLPFVLLASALLTYAAEAPMDDAELTRRLVGTWVTDPADNGQFVNTDTYNTNGTGTVSVRMRGQPESTSLQLTVQWSVTDGLLCLKSVTSSNPERIPVGLELKDRIISISGDPFVFEVEKGYGASKGKQGVKLRKKAT